MSLITIIAKGPHDIDWEKVFPSIKELELNELEIFPIPSELGFEFDAIGIAAPSNYGNKEKLVMQLRHLVELLCSMQFKLTELYNGVLIDNGSLGSILLPLLGSSISK